jgi:hypothetical protein
MTNFKKMYKVNTANEYQHSTPLACCNNDTRRMSKQNCNIGTKIATT